MTSKDIPLSLYFNEQENPYLSEGSVWGASALNFGQVRGWTDL